MQGWPNSIKQVKEIIKSYFKIRDELTILNDMIFKGNCLVIPDSLRNEMMTRIHYNHLGARKCLDMAKNSIFWPGMANQVTQKIQSCYICQKFSKSQTPEPLISHEIPLLPWNKIGCDLFEVNGEKFLLLIDYYSKYLEVEKLNQTINSFTVIQIMKSIFARHGIPRTVVSDGGPQFSSDIFKQFAKEWEFTHVMSSPTYAKSNGLAERNVQTAKNIFKKVFEDHKDIHLALLFYRNMPIFDNVCPAQLLMSRKLRTTIPVKDSYLKPAVIGTKMYSKFLESTQQAQQHNYNKPGVRELTDIRPNTKVTVQLKPKGIWVPGSVIQKLRNRTYKIKTDNGQEYIRNRIFIKITPYIVINLSKNVVVG